MQRMGLTRAELRAYHRALCSSHQIRVTVTLCDLEENPIESITPVVLEGQITVDVTAEVSRLLTLKLLDPQHHLSVDTRRPNDGAVFIDRIIEIRYGVWVEELDRWVTCRPFTGVPWKLVRDGAVVDIEAHGKERLLMRPAFEPWNRGKRARKWKVIREFFAERGGERRFAFAHPKSRLAHPFAVGRHHIMWTRGRRLAASMDRQLFFDGRGVCTLRTRPKHPLITFHGGPGGALLSPVEVDTDPSTFKNTWFVRGRKEMKPVEVTLKPHRQMSPRRLARNGVPGHITGFTKNKQIRSRAEARRRGRRRLEKAATEVVDRSYDILPMPHLDELDKVRVVASTGHGFNHRLETWSLPLTTEGSPPMTIGYDQRQTASRRVRKL